MTPEETNNPQETPRGASDSEKTPPPHREVPPLMELNVILKSPIRFNLVFLLYIYNRVGFTRLQKLLHTSAGNLEHHLRKLIESDWIQDSVVFSPRPLKVYKITPKGKDEFKDYVDQLQKIVHSLDG